MVYGMYRATTLASKDKGLKTWISNYINFNALDEITYPFPNFNGVAIEVLEWVSNFIPRFIMDVIAYLC